MTNYEILDELNTDFYTQFVELADNRIFLAKPLSRYIDRELTRRYKRAYKALQRLERQKDRDERRKAKECARQLRQKQLRAFLNRLKTFFRQPSGAYEPGGPNVELKTGQGASQPLAGTGQRPVCSSPLTPADGLKTDVCVPETEPATETADAL